MKALLAIVAVAFLVVSFAFFDGWPFRSAPDAAIEETEAPRNEGRVLEDLAREQGKGAPVNEGVRPASQLAVADTAAVLEAQEKLVRARDAGIRPRLETLSALVLRLDLPEDLRKKSRDELHEIQREQLWRGGRGLDDLDRVVVGRGDNLTRIARRQNQEKGGNISPALLIKLNGLRNDRIRAGQALMVPSGDLKLIVVKRDYWAYLLLDGVIVADYPVGLGRDDSTPEGRFKIVGKTVNPDWTMPDGRLVPYGDPEHIIGSRWLGFEDEQGKTSYGIHGTVDDASIGKSESDGCVRMLKDDVEELFELLPEGSTVELVP